MSVIEERLPYLEPLVLESGGHDAPNNGLVHACVMEAVAYVAGEPWSDHPECASPVLGAFLRSSGLRLTEEEAAELRWVIGDPEDHYGDPDHPLRTIKAKLVAR